MARSPSSTRVIPRAAAGSSPACCARAMPVAVAMVPSMPASPRFACTGIFLPGTTASSLADEPRRRQHQPVVRPARVPDREGQRVTRDRLPQPGELRARERRLLEQVVADVGGAGLVVQLLEQRARRLHPAPDPRAGRLEGRTARRRIGDGDGIHESAHAVPGVVVVDAGRAHHDRLGAAALDQRRNLTTESGMPEHDDALDPVPEIGGPEKLAVGRDQVRPESRAARHLGQQWSSQRACHGLRLGSRTGARDDDSAGGGFELERSRGGSTGGSRQARPADRGTSRADAPPTTAARGTAG